MIVLSIRLRAMTASLVLPLTEGTLKLWRKEIRGKGFAASAGEQQSEQWSTRDKFLIVVETSTLSEWSPTGGGRSTRTHAKELIS